MSGKQSKKNGEKRSASEVYLNNVSNVFVKNRLLQIAVVTLLAVTVINSYTLLKVSREQRNYIVPVNVGGEIWITSKNASDDYLKSMAEYVVHNVASYTPASIEKQYNGVLEAFHPSSYPRYREMFQEITEKAQRYSSVSSTVHIDYNKPFIIEDGRVHLYAFRSRIAGNAVTNKDYVKYTIHYRIEAGRYWVKEIEEKVDA